MINPYGKLECSRCNQLRLDCHCYDKPMPNKTFVDRVAAKIENMLKHQQETGTYEITKLSTQIAKMVEEMLPEETTEEEHTDICHNDVYVEGWNNCLAEIRLRLKGGV